MISYIEGIPMTVKIVAFNLFRTLLENDNTIKEAYKRMLADVKLPNDENMLKDLMIVEQLKQISDDFEREVWWEEFFRSRGLELDEVKLKEMKRIFWAKRLQLSRPAKGVLETLKKLKLIGLRTTAISCEDAGKILIRSLLERTGLFGLLDSIFCLKGRSNELRALDSIVKMHGVKKDEIAYVDVYLERVITAKANGFVGIWLSDKKVFEITSVNSVNSITELPSLLSSMRAGPSWFHRGTASSTFF